MCLGFECNMLQLHVVKWATSSCVPGAQALQEYSWPDRVVQIHGYALDRALTPDADALFH